MASPNVILIEHPVALVDKYVDKHGVREVAEAFVNFLWTQDAQRAYAKFGLRPVSAPVAAEVKDQFPKVQDLWKMDFLGGWKKVTDEVYGPQGLYTRITEELQKSR
jgi:sulfate transport system substrate-binding protein